MGQKVHPYGFRLGYTKNWRSRWYAGHGYADLVHEDLKIKDQLRSRLKAAGISSIEIDRPGNKLRITIRTARPGIIIGRRGAEIEKLKAELQKKTNRDVYIDIQEVHRPEMDAQLVAESVAIQIEKRVAFRRAMRKAVDSALRFGCKGIKIWVSGRLNGKEIARTEWHLQGRLPLQTLRADIDYGFCESHTTYGVIGVKCWVYKGDILEMKSKSAGDDLEPARRREARSAGERTRERVRRGDERPAVAAGPAAATVAPVVATVAPVVATVAPVVATAAPVAAPVAPVTPPVAPVVATPVAPVVTPVTPVAAPVAPVAGSAAAPVAPAAPEAPAAPAEPTPASGAPIVRPPLTDKDGGEGSTEGSGQ